MTSGGASGPHRWTAGDEIHPPLESPSVIAGLRCSEAARAADRFQPIARIPHEALRGPLRYPEALGGLVQRVSLEEVEIDHPSLACGECLEGAPENLDALVAFERLLR